MAIASFGEIPRDKVSGATVLIRTLKGIFPRRLKRKADAAIGIYGETNVVLKRIDLTGMGESDWESAAFAEAAQYLPQSGNDFLKGFSTINPVRDPTGEGGEVVFVGLRRSMCEFYDEVLMSSHRNPVAFDAAGLALAATYQRASMRSEDTYVVLLDLGEFSTKLFLLKNGGFFFSDETEAGCRPIVSALQSKLGVALWPAVALLSGKKAVGLEPEYAAQHVLEELEVFTERVRDMLWRARRAGRTLMFDRSLVCGGGASIPPIRAALSPLFRYGIATLDPFPGLIYTLKELPKAPAVPTPEMFAVALGLALRSRYTKAQKKEASVVLPGHKRLLGH